MKNGLVLLLLMVALVAMTVSAGAMAPVVGPLPAVIIGGADAVDQATPGVTVDVNLLRYVNVFNLADPGVITRRTNPDDATKLSVWYTVSGTSAATLKASNKSAVKEPITEAEIDSISSATARTAIASKKINTNTDTWLSLIEDTGTLGAGGAEDQNVEDNGVSSGSLQSVVGQKRITLYAIDVTGDAPNAVGSGGFDVYSLLASNDGLYPRTNICNDATPSDPDAYDKWFKTGTRGYNQTASSVGFTGVSLYSGTAPNKMTYQYSTWARYISPVVNDIGTIYEAKATMEGSATNGVNTPGFRLWFIANSGVHSGGVHAVTISGLTGLLQNIPIATAPKEIRAYWSAPRELVDMEDDGFLETSGSNDKREYALQFDMVQEGAEIEDAGKTIIMTAFNLDMIPRPVSVVPAIQWGEGFRPMNKSAVDVDDGFVFDDSQPVPTGFSRGFGSVGYSNITMGMGAVNAAYAKVYPAGGTYATCPAWTSGKLIRTTWNMQAVNPPGVALAATNVPSFRLQMFGLNSATFMPSAIRADNVFQYDAVRATKPSVTNPVHPIMSGTPKAAGSDIECYFYTHTAPNIAGMVVHPMIDVIQSNRSLTGNTGVVTPGYSSNWNGWGKPGNIVINGIKMEVLNP